jgi:hypothetical protein
MSADGIDEKVHTVFGWNTRKGETSWHTGVRGCGGARLPTGFVWLRTGIFGGLVEAVRRQGVF